MNLKTKYFGKWHLINGFLRRNVLNYQPFMSEWFVVASPIYYELDPAKFLTGIQGLTQSLLYQGCCQ